MLKQLQKLIDVKSIVTIVLTLVVAYLAVTESIDIKDVYIMIISFYFGTQHQKREDDVNE